MQQHDSGNLKFELAASFVNHTACHVFLTGKAGTGKTTFLKYIINNTSKKAVVSAPTGVAAVNAGGVTIHSLFQLPLGIYNPEPAHQYKPDVNSQAYNRQYLLKNLRLSKSKRKLLKEMELLIIDEVSMLRGDVLDAIDTVLRHIRSDKHIPFGGVQLLLIGDLFQLPPVVRQEEQEIINRHYNSPFFFDAHALHKIPPVCIELTKIYRQNEQEFINLLNKIRKNEINQEDIDRLNRFYQPDFKPDPQDNYITLSTHNYKARKINEEALKALPGSTHRYEAEVEGNFHENAFPADKQLQLKEGAQIMFIRNDTHEVPRYYNGKIAIVNHIEEQGIQVRFPEENYTIWLEKEEWKNKQYTYNDEKQSIEEKHLGTFRQYPVRLAWAVTIHKSQGLTFKKAIIDAEGAFSAGQIYVALSRLISMEGLVLHSKLSGKSIQCHNAVLHFMEQHAADEQKLNKLLEREQKAFILNLLKKTFDWENLLNIIDEHIETYENKSVTYKDSALEYAGKWKQAIINQKQIADKFINKLKKISEEGESAYPLLHERSKAAVDYFNQQLDETLLKPIQEHSKDFRKKKNIKSYIQNLTILENTIQSKKQQLKQVVQLTAGLVNGSDTASLLHKYAKNKKQQDEPAIKSKKPAKGESKKITLQLYKEGKNIEDIQKERDMARSTIEGHITEFIKTGDISVYDYISAEKINTILPLVKDSNDLKASPIKEQLGEACSYNEIRAVINHWLWLKNENNKTTA